MNFPEILKEQPRNPRLFVGRRVHELVPPDVGDRVVDRVDQFRNRNRMTLRLKFGAGRYAACLSESRPK